MNSVEKKNLRCVSAYYRYRKMIVIVAVFFLLYAPLSAYMTAAERPLVPGDTDSDGLKNSLEHSVYRTDARNPDTDGDGLTDGDEVYIYGSSPTLANTDGDMFDDYMEAKVLGRNPAIYQDFFIGYFVMSGEVTDVAGSRFQDIGGIISASGGLSEYARTVSTSINIPTRIYDMSEFFPEGYGPSELRNFMKGEYDSGLLGAVFVGAAPTAFNYCYFCGSAVPVYHPMEQFYTDMEGSWQDAYDGGPMAIRTYGLSAEMWLGHLRPYGNDAEVKDQLMEYFKKAADYLEGRLVFDDAALYLQGLPISVGGYRKAYAENYLVSTSSRSVYDAEMTRPYELLELSIHGSIDSELYFDGVSYYGGLVTSPQVRDMENMAGFYILNSCSNGKYSYYSEENTVVTTDSIGTSYIFGSGQGLGVVTSTEVWGGLNQDAEFFSYVNNGNMMGTAFIAALNAWNQAPALVYLGDPSLPT